MPTVLLGVTGCIGAYKACEILRELQRRGVDVRVVMTEAATRFVGVTTFEALSRHPVYVDLWASSADGVEHIDLASSVDLLLVAPATANTIGKLAHGLADDALTTVALATRAPLLLAPAMNVHMYEHPAVQENLETLRRRGAGIVEPGSGYLACGWEGKGRLAEPLAIVDAALRLLSPRRDLEGETVLVTAGPTVEDLDPVRFVSNRSTGTMGYRLAEAARDRGAVVTLVSGPVSLPPLGGVSLVSVRTALEMEAAVVTASASAGIVVMAAAVSDYRPAARAKQKVKKSGETLTLELVRNPDILEALGKQKQPGQILVGFAAETESPERNARGKLVKKNLDLVVANDVTEAGAGFGGETNRALLIDRDSAVDSGLVSKRDLAEQILDRALELRKSAKGVVR